MAFYFALFNVSNVNNELKNNKQGKSKGPQQKGNSRRHSVSSTHNIAIDYRLLPRPRVISSNHQLYHPPTPPSSRRRSTPEHSSVCQCELDSLDNGKSKKVTFTPSDDGHLSTAVPRRYSHGSSLEDNPDVTQSMYPEVDSSRAQRAAEWIYSISLSEQDSREDRGSMDNGNRSPSPVGKRPSIPDVVISPGSTTSKILPNIQEIEKEEIHVIRPQIIESSSNPSSVPPIVISNYPKSPPRKPVNNHPGSKPVAVQSRPPSRLPSILRRRSTSDRSASLTTVFRRSIPYRNMSPHKTENPRRNSSSEKTNQSPRRPSRLPRPSKIQKIRCGFNPPDPRHESVPLIEIERNPDSMIKSHIY